MTVSDFHTANWRARFQHGALALAVLAALAACSSDDASDNSPTPDDQGSAVIPAAPAGLGKAATAAAPNAAIPEGRTDVPPRRIHAMVDRNQKGQIDPVTGYSLNNAGYPSGSDDACYADATTNLSIRPLKGFLDIWQPVTPYMDAYQRAIAASQVTTKEGRTFTCPAIPMTSWTGIPGDATDGAVLNAAVHDANLRYSGKVTAADYRNARKALAAYLDDARGKSFSVSLGLGPLAGFWHALARQESYIDAIPPAAPNGVCPDGSTDGYPFCSAPDDEAYNIGAGASHDKASSVANNAAFGVVSSFIMRATNDGTASTNPTKYFYKYARPYRWHDAGLSPVPITVSPGLENARKVPENGASVSDIRKDSDFPSGHTAEAVRGAFAYGYVVPQRFQEMLARGLELGDNRIVAGMHSALAVMGGRINGEIAALNLINRISRDDRDEALARAQQQLRMAAYAATNDPAVVTDAGFLAYARSQANASAASPFDAPYADHAANKREYRRRLTFGFTQDATKAGQPAVVPEGAETLLETRLPYLTAEQRRIVLKSTALDSGWPVLDDEEGFGRLNYFDAADGYGNFRDGDVAVTMDADKGGFHAHDAWRNDIDGEGKLTKLGSGALELAGANAFTGGLVISGGAIIAASQQALGNGMVYLNETGALQLPASDKSVQVGGDYVQTGTTTLQPVLQSTNAAPLDIKGKAILDKSSVLAPSLPADAKAGQVYPVLRASALSGTFGAIRLPGGVKATAIYDASSVSLRIE